jgi:hypothetical protein
MKLGSTTTSVKEYALPYWVIQYHTKRGREPIRTLEGEPLAAGARLSEYATLYSPPGVFVSDRPPGRALRRSIRPAERVDDLEEVGLVRHPSEVVERSVLDARGHPPTTGVTPWASWMMAQRAGQSNVG